MALLKRSRPEGPEGPEGTEGAEGSTAVGDEGRMPLMDHLRELRNRLVISVIALVLATIVGLIFFDPIWAFISGPYCRLDISHTVRDQCTFAVRSVFESFLVNIKVAALVGLVVASPVWIYQIWGFVTPALYRNEKRYTVTFLGLAVPLFFAGAVFAYLIMDTGLSFLLSFMPASAVPLIEMDDYLGYWMIILLLFGVSFELPLLMVFLNIIGVLKRASLVKHRRMIIFGLFLFSGVITPGGDAFTMIALTIPMIVLFSLAELFMYLREKRLPRTEDYSELDDDEASPLDLDSDPDPR
ncbi:twin-arginine translocase subunit TatC [Nonomuraea sp. NBC_01738]|uniref:twin-arginine translocase subunit TatC n=1 Tax=Nonomuraea sp. NBC_01738 TaxID=2976003 RepID=UPI002E1414CE|nr:twin-arginine translocase subunit TatC [Nonomuraea sp. NBC_01738]